MGVERIVHAKAIGKVEIEPKLCEPVRVLGNWALDNLARALRCLSHRPLSVVTMSNKPSLSQYRYLDP